MQAKSLSEFMTFAHRMADGSNAIIRAAARNRQGFAAKADKSPVTEIDLQVEETLRRCIAAEYPEHGILGEEFDPTRLDADYVWVIDPIDGTKDFIAGLPTFGTLIALAYRGMPVLGIIDLPATGDRWAGADGIPTTWNGAPVRVRSCSALSEALICTSSPEYYRGDERQAFDRLRSSVHWCVYGGGCYAYGCLARGAIDIGIESGHDPADYCALVPVIRGAGGLISDWEGNPLTIRSGKRFIAAGNERIHTEALGLLAGVSARAS